MYNNEALTHSQDVIQEQIKFVLQTRPYIKAVIPIDSVTNQKTDYLYGIDARTQNADGTSCTIQFKNRKSGNSDFVISAKRLSGIAANNGSIGFFYKNTKYALMPMADLYVECIDGLNYAISRDEINSIETYLDAADDSSEFISGIQPKYIVADDGSRFPSGEYYVFISREKLGEMLVRIYSNYNPNIFD